MDAIALVVPAFRIPSTKLMSIYERTREIGLITTMGATNRGAMSVYLAKARPIGLVHGLGGVLIQSGPGFFIAVIAGIYLAAHATQTGAAPAEISITYTSLWFPRLRAPVLHPGWHRLGNLSSRARSLPQPNRGTERRIGCTRIPLNRSPFS